MRLNLELTSLENIMKDFYTVTHIRSSIYDGNYKKILSYPRQHTPICSIMHDDPEANTFCKESNLQAFKKCSQEKRVIVYTCHLGLSEVAAPLLDGDVVIGYVLFGQLTNSPDRKGLTEFIQTKCAEYGILSSISEQLPEIVSHVHYLSQEQILSTARLLEACTYYIMHHEIIRLNRTGFIMKLDEYIDRHLTDKISISDLCNEFFMSRTKLYETFNDALHMNIGHYIRLKRIERAKHFLAETDMTLMEIATESGLGEYNYFCNVFKKEVGMTANQYRLTFRK